MGMELQYIAVFAILIVVLCAIIRYFYKQGKQKNHCSNCSERACCHNRRIDDRKKCCK
ncbi:MAG: FeoB-associated Cys-rich membrane protein [Muribaculaceae bacterium]